MWRCTVCNFTLDSEDMPDNCPKCGAPKEKFIVLEDAQAGMLRRAQLSNQLHMELAALMDKAIKVAKQGEEDNLDPGCLKVFKTAIEQCGIINQMVKAEIMTHVNKNKW